MYDLDEDSKPELNITPLVDIMLVLVAILMLTTPLMIYEEKINLPKGSKSTRYESQGNAIEVRIDKTKNIYIDTHKFAFAAFPDSFLQFSNNLSKDKKVLIRADKNLRYQDVIFVLKSVKAAKFHKISLVTDA